ncbi:MAG: CorA family divalent cation transporter [Patescibacteria group bacterium]
MKSIVINKLQWILITDPKEKDIQFLKNKLNIHPLILDEILVPSDRSKVERYDDYIFMVYHLPIYDVEHRTSRRAEIDIIAKKNTLVAVTYENLEPILQFERDLEKKFSKEIKTTAEMIYHLIEEVHNFSLRQLKHVEAKVNFVGDQLFKRQDRKLLEEISRIKRDILDFTIIAVPQRTMLESLLNVGTKFWGENLKIYFSDLLGDFLKVNYLLKNLRATVESYSETISQIFEFKTSEVIRRFSILAFLGVPLLLYATIALQPKIDHSLINSPSDYWLQLGIVTVLVIILAIIFRKKGWL